MEYRSFGKTGFKVSMFGMGTYYDLGWIASAKFLRFSNGKERHVHALKSGIDAGVNLIDTAEIYGTEHLVGEASRGYDREKLFIASKVFMTHLRYDSVIKACNRSLKHLGMKYIDLYQVHFPNKFVKIAETMKALEKLVTEGKIRYIGVSNFSLEQMHQAEESLKENPLTSTQMPYNLFDRKLENVIIPHCVENKIAVLAYFPLAHGKLRSDRPKIRETVEELSRKHPEKTPAQIALNWFYSKHDQVFPIPRASNSEHVLENVGSTGWNLNEDEISLLEQSFQE